MKQCLLLLHNQYSKMPSQLINHKYNPAKKPNPLLKFICHLWQPNTKHKEEEQHLQESQQPPKHLNTRIPSEILCQSQGQSFNITSY